MKTTTIIPILLVLLLTAIAGCVDPSNIVSPLYGNWETKILGFTQTIRFENNGTGVFVTTLGQQAFQFQIVDSDTLLIKTENDNDWEEKSYNIVNNNTLQYDGQTWVRQGSV